MVSKTRIYMDVKSDFFKCGNAYLYKGFSQNLPKQVSNRLRKWLRNVLRAAPKVLNSNETASQSVFKAVGSVFWEQLEGTFWSHFPDPRNSAYPNALTFYTRVFLKTCQNRFQTGSRSGHFGVISSIFKFLSDVFCKIFFIF